MARKRTRSSQPFVDRWPCVFRDLFVREVIDPRVAELWMATYATKAPFGDLRKTWKQRHCRVLNPGGSDFCRFTSTECAMAFLTAVQKTVGPDHPKPMGYYRALVATMADMRADRRPLSREARPRNPGDVPVHIGTRSAINVGSLDRTQAGRSGEPLLPEEQDHLRRAVNRPESIGKVLRSLNIGPREIGTTDGEKSTER